MIGGCNVETKELLKDSLNSIDMILFYTGYNPGNECEMNMIYAYYSPNEEVFPVILRVLYDNNDSPVLFYGEESYYTSRVDFIKSIYKAVDIPILYEAKVSLSNLKDEIVKMRFKIGSSGTIIALLHFDLVDEFFKLIKTKLCEKISSEECAELYKVHLIDESHIKYDPQYALNQNIYSSFLDDDSQIVDDFIEKYTHISGESIQPNYYDALISTSTTFLLNAISSSQSVDRDLIRQSIYKTTASTEIGTAKVENNNYIFQSVIHGKVGTDGNAKASEILSNSWKTRPYRLELNEITYKYCDWSLSGDYVRSLILIGIIIPQSSNYFKEGIMFLNTLLTEIDSINNDGGVLDEYIGPYIFSDADDPEIAYDRLIEANNKYNVSIFFGGWDTKIRNKLEVAVLNTNSVIFYPKDYEGSECHYNGYYLGLPITSYVYLFYI